MTDPSSPLHFFDVTSNLPLPRTSWSPNTLRTRLALNFKRIPYTQSYISYPDIQPLLQSLSVPPLSGLIPYTLPAIHHPPSLSTATINDSWPIALHLERTFHGPQHPSLFPSPASYPLAVAVGRVLAVLFTHTRRILMAKVPVMLDERGAEYFRKTRAGWFGCPLEEYVFKEGEELEGGWREFEGELEVVVKMLRGEGKEKKEGPFFEGETAGYADLMVVAFLGWYERVDRGDFERIVKVGDGELRRLWEACLPWVDGQGEEREWVVKG
ncbi:hypothetical protein FQN50_005088 [Emmonsiellopsis sp. PD_5]|nr:hypothetical protein FQN50_005088 [Emmonsiellopsis sp. PD_5]